MTDYPSSIITWVDRVDNVNYYYASDVNVIIAEVKGIATDLVGVSGTAGGLAQGGASFYARWTAQHNTSGSHKSITTDTLNASGLITASGGVQGNVTGNLTGNADTATNGVVTTGSYPDPSWITSLAGAKISGNISGNAGTATSATTAGTVTTAAQPNITSLGTLTALAISGSSGTDIMTIVNGGTGNGLKITVADASAGFWLQMSNASVNRYFVVDINGRIQSTAGAEFTGIVSGGCFNSSIASVTGNTTSVAVSGVGVVNFTGGYSLGGMTGAATGQVVHLTNISGNTATIENNNTNVSANDRFYTTSGSNLTGTRVLWVAVKTATGWLIQ